MYSSIYREGEGFGTLWCQLDECEKSREDGEDENNRNEQVIFNFLYNQCL